MRAAILLGALAVTAVGAAWLVMEKIMENDKKSFYVGDLVQWESNGSLVFETPKKIIKIVDSIWGKFAYFENSETAVPFNELVMA